MKDYYQVLQVHPIASDETIKKVFKYLIKKNHPDLFSGEKKLEAEKITMELNEAYEILSNSEKRKQYDEDLKLNVSKYDALLKENEILKEQINFLNSTIEKKDFIINSFLDDKSSSQLSNIYDIEAEKFATKNFSGSEEFDDTEKTDSIFKNILFSLFITFKELFLGPLILILILILISLVLKSTIK